MRPQNESHVWTRNFIRQSLQLKLDDVERRSEKDRGESPGGSGSPAESRARKACLRSQDRFQELFQQYSWPGNIRELRSIVKRCVFTGRTESIRQEDLSFDFAQRLASPPVNLGNHDEQLRELSRQLVAGRPETMPRQQEQGGRPFRCNAK